MGSVLGRFARVNDGDPDAVSRTAYVPPCTIEVCTVARERTAHLDRLPDSNVSENTVALGGGVVERSVISWLAPVVFSRPFSTRKSIAGPGCTWIASTSSPRPPAEGTVSLVKFWFPPFTKT